MRSASVPQNSKMQEKNLNLHKTIAMKYVALMGVVLGTLLASCDSANKERPTSKYEEKKQSIAEMERESPLKFLRISGSYHRNMVSREVVEGTVTNKATLTTYKNIAVQIDFLDKAGKSVEQQEHNLDEVVSPGQTASFKIKVKHVDEASSVKLDIISADSDK